MKHRSLTQIDTNLLVALDILLELRSVTKAANKMHVTQPAMSQTLRRLRHLFDDPLLVRVKGEMALTPRAKHLVTPLRQALTQLRGVLETQPEFVPEDSELQFRAIFQFGSAIIRCLNQEAPKAALHLKSLTLEKTIQALQNGELDVATGVFPAKISGLLRESLYEESYLCVVDKRHPLSKLEELSLQEFISYPHGMFSPTGYGDSFIDTLLREQGVTRHVATRVPHFQYIPSLLLGTNLIFTVPSRFAEYWQRWYPIQLFQPPVSVPTYTLELLWNKRLDHDPAHIWLRDLVKKVALSNEPV